MCTFFKVQHFHIFLKSAADTAVRNMSICICYQEIKRNSFEGLHGIFNFFRLRLE